MQDNAAREILRLDENTTLALLCRHCKGVYGCVISSRRSRYQTFIGPYRPYLTTNRNGRERSYLRCGGCETTLQTCRLLSRR